MLRGIDMTLTIKGAAEAVRAGGQAALAGRPEVAGQMFADRLEKQTRMQEKQVVQAPEAEKPDVNPDRKGHGGGYQPNRETRKKTEAKPAAKSKYVTESMYDIKI